MVNYKQYITPKYYNTFQYSIVEEDNFFDKTQRLAISFSFLMLSNKLTNHKEHMTHWTIKFFVEISKFYLLGVTKYV